MKCVDCEFEVNDNNVWIKQFPIFVGLCDTFLVVFQIKQSHSKFFKLHYESCDGKDFICPFHK